MPRITPGNRLYIYQLLSREIGMGKQTLLSRVEAVFATDDLLPEDMGCASVQEVLEQLGDIIKLTVFKKGNTYATLLRNEEFDRALEQAEEAVPAKKAQAKGRPWKHRGKTKTIRPTKPRHPKPQQAEQPADQDEPKTAEQAPLPTQEDKESANIPGDSRQEPPSPTGESSENDNTEPQEASERPSPQPAEEPQAEVSQTTSPSVTRLEVVSPSEEQAVSFERVLVGLPEDFTSDVNVPNGPLSLLYQLVSPETNPLDLLGQDWQTARSIRSYEGTRSLVSFPLRLIHSDGTPVLATIRRTPRAASGKHWTLDAIDGSSGGDSPATDAGIDGLASGTTSAERLLARDIELGPLDQALRALAQVVAPERWSVPGEPDAFGILSVYLASTWRAVCEQDRLVRDAEGSRAAFATGLLSPLSQPVYACLAASDGEAACPWRLLGFSTTGEGALGELLASLPSLPTAPCYLESLASLQLNPSARPDVPRHILRMLGDGADDVVSQGLERSRANYRLVAPAVDPETGKVHLLVPLATTDAVTPDTALVLDPTPGGPLAATGLLDLASAYAEARVVGRGMPDWLDAMQDA